MTKIDKMIGKKMLGFGDVWIAIAFWANIVVVLICVVYGVINWNKGDDEIVTPSKKKRSKK